MSEAADNHALAARFARLHGIVSRMRWTDYGVLATSEGTKAALEDLFEYLFADGIDAALASQPHTEDGATDA